MKLDSIYTNCISTQIAQCTNTDANDMNTLPSIFILSIALLTFISLMKYFMANAPQKAEWGHFFLEYPIDICTIAITIIITYFFNLNSINHVMIIIFCTLIITLICCMLRRSAINSLSKEKISYSPYIYGFLDMMFAIGWIVIIYIYHIKQIL